MEKFKKKTKKIRKFKLKKFPAPRPHPSAGTCRNHASAATVRGERPPTSPPPQRDQPGLQGFGAAAAAGGGLPPVQPGRTARSAGREEHAEGAGGGVGGEDGADQGLLPGWDVGLVRVELQRGFGDAGAVGSS